MSVESKLRRIQTRLNDAELPWHELNWLQPKEELETEDFTIELVEEEVHMGMFKMFAKVATIVKVRPHYNAPAYFMAVEQLIDYCGDISEGDIDVYKVEPVTKVVWQES